MMSIRLGILSYYICIVSHAALISIVSTGAPGVSAPLRRLWHTPLPISKYATARNPLSPMYIRCDLEGLIRPAGSDLSCGARLRLTGPDASREARVR